MRDIILNPSFHFTLLTLFALVGYILFISKLLIKAEKETIKLKKAADPKNWREIPITVVEKGFNIKYDYPNTYINTYPDIMSEEESSHAAAEEFESYKKRKRAHLIEKANKGITIEYNDAEGNTFNRITFTNNETLNYESLLKENRKSAFQYIPNTKVVCYELLTEHEADLFYKKNLNHAIKASVIGIIPVGAIILTTLSTYS